MFFFIVLSHNNARSKNGQSTVRERSEYSMTFLSTGSARAWSFTFSNKLLYILRAIISFNFNFSEHCKFLLKKQLLHPYREQYRLCNLTHQHKFGPYSATSPIRLPACNGENLLPLVIIVSMCKVFSPERVARVTLYKSIVLNGWFSEKV